MRIAQNVHIPAAIASIKLLTLVNRAVRMDPCRHKVS